MTTLPLSPRYRKAVTLGWINVACALSGAFVLYQAWLADMPGWMSACLAACAACHALLVLWCSLVAFDEERARRELIREMQP